MPLCRKTHPPGVFTAPSRDENTHLAARLSPPHFSLIIPLLVLAFAIPAKVLPEDILLNEIMYNPSGPENYCEYVELFNNGETEVDLAGWILSDGSGSDTLQAAAADSGMTLAPGEYALVLDPGYWEHGFEWYDDVIPPGTLLLTVPGAALGSGGLSNYLSEPVTLLSPYGTIVDGRSYHPGAPGGVSEERILFNGDGGDDNWGFSTPGGTPGSRNSITPPQNDLALDTLTLSVEMLEEEPVYVLYLRLFVRNRGLTITSARRLEIAFDRHLQSSTNNVFTYLVPSLSTGNSTVVADSLLDPPPGRYRVRAVLEAGDDLAANDSLTGFFRIPYPPRSLSFSEIMAAPPVDVPVEWVEWENLSAESIPLGGWKFSDASGRAAVLDSSAPEQAEGAFQVIARDSTIFSWPGLPPELCSLPLGWPGLNNDGDTLTLYDPAGTEIEKIAFPSSTAGISFFRICRLDTFSLQEWALSEDSLVATPGQATPVPAQQQHLRGQSVQISPNPFAPLSGGPDSRTTFTFDFPAQQVIISVRIFDVNGRLLGIPLERHTAPGLSSWTWDGSAGLTAPLKTGMYVYHVQAESTTDNDHWEVKGVLVSAGSGGN